MLISEHRNDAQRDIVDAARFGELERIKEILEARPEAVHDRTSHHVRRY